MNKFILYTILNGLAWTYIQYYQSLDEYERYINKEKSFLNGLFLILGFIFLFIAFIYAYKTVITKVSVLNKIGFAILLFMIWFGLVGFILVIAINIFN